MGLFVVSYDLIKRKEYQPLWDEMKRLGGHKPVESVYLLNLNLDSASAVRDHFKTFIDEDDLLIVAKFVGKPSFLKAKSGTNAWIDKNC
ncbi:hypothetical protein [Luteimonas fraxinea]|uniref:Uncharacterized protein n=1 Tax=Luteimonas fraxinea TaxID=2901869 RepID=A0ABS8U9M8_9GAMM|nr:hypothetical protein [Luteimonas fraxinea]MCD9096203.1 hypothetical protein [Luteimonas fraxinea]